MAKKHTLTDAEFDRQYEVAGRELAEPLALEADYRADLGLVWVQLSNECVFGFPPHLVEGLGDAPERTVAEVEILGGGCGLRWDSLDLDLSVTGLLLGSLGTRAWMREIGRKGGQSTSDAKAEAARRNGRKGGRPASRPPSEAEEPAPPQTEKTDLGVLYWDSKEPPAARSVEVPVVAREDSLTTPAGWRRSPSSTTPSSRTPARAA